MVVQSGWWCGGGESFGGEVQFGEKQADFIALLGEAES